MMDYEVFKAVIAKRIRAFLPPVFHTYKVETTVVRKVNEEKDTLLIMPPDEKNMVAMPNIYLDDMYRFFQKSEDIDEILEMIAALVVRYTGSFPRDEINLRLKEKKNSIVMNLINTKRNQGLLREVPHRNIMDLSIIYRIIVRKVDQGLMTILMDNRIMEEMGLTQEELERLAYANTSRMFPVEICKMADFLYVMTNRQKIHGATTMICREAMEQLAKQIGSNFYLIPSSIHEVMAVPEQNENAEDLVRLLEQGNQTCSTESEILSESIYYYDSGKKEFSMAASYGN